MSDQVRKILDTLAFMPFEDVYLLPAWQHPLLPLELEAIILRATEPPYNARIPPEG